MAVLAAIAAGVIVATVIYITYLTIKKLKQLLRERLERNRKSKVAFGKTRKILDEHAKDILASAPSITMEELEKVCEDTPYFIVDYDSNTDEISDYTTIRADGIDEKIEDLMSDNEGIILFD